MILGERQESFSMKNIIVGLTGQTGAGKSTISHYLSENGVTVIGIMHL